MLFENLFKKRIHELFLSALKTPLKKLLVLQSILGGTNKIHFLDENLQVFLWTKYGFFSKLALKENLKSMTIYVVFNGVGFQTSSINPSTDFVSVRSISDDEELCHQKKNILLLTAEERFLQTPPSPQRRRISF